MQKSKFSNKKFENSFVESELFKLLLKKLGAVSSDAKRIHLPRLLEQRIGSLYLVSEVDHRVLKGDLARAYEILRQETETLFDCALHDAEQSGFKRDWGIAATYVPELARDSAEALLFERYPFFFERHENICKLAKVSAKSKD